MNESNHSNTGMFIVGSIRPVGDKWQCRISVEFPNGTEIEIGRSPVLFDSDAEAIFTLRKELNIMTEKDSKEGFKFGDVQGLIGATSSVN